MTLDFGSARSLELGKCKSGIPQIGLVHGVKFPREMKKIAITPSGTCNFFALQGRCTQAFDIHRRA